MATTTAEDNNINPAYLDAIDKFTKKEIEHANKSLQQCFPTSIKAEIIEGLRKCSTRRQARMYIQNLIRWWLQYISVTMNHIFKEPIRRAHHVGASIVVTIDPSHVKRLKIDDRTFFIQKTIENGIILEMRKLNTMSWKQKASQIGDSSRSPQSVSVVNDSSNNRQTMPIGSEPP
jgi:hypothetical protein